jgi:hypothetical protein
MIQVYTNPSLLDFLKVCACLPDDERQQIELSNGVTYDVDGAALGNYEASAAGPRWVIKDGELVLTIGGFVQQRPGVWRDFMLNVPEAFGPKYWRAITRVAKNAMDGMLREHAHRLECIAPVARLAARPEIEKWYRFLGYTREATLWGYYADGSDAVSFSRVRH